MCVKKTQEGLQAAQDVFMELIEKQAAVTRLATALQNRMLKDPQCDLVGFRV